MNVERLRTHLRLNRLRRTPQRELFFDAIGKLQPISRQNLARELAGQLSHTSSYRLIHEFIKIDVVIQSTDGLLSLSDRFMQHHHTRLCRACGARTNFGDTALEKALIKAAQKADFILEDHRLELIGLCRQCRLTHPARTAINTNLRRAPVKLTK